MRKQYMPESPKRKVVVTGGAQGIGRAICEAFLREQAFVSPWDIDREALSELTGLFRAQKNLLLPLACDVAEPASVENASSKLLDAWGKVDVLVNNAGIFLNRPLAECEPSEWDRVLAVNVKSIFLTARALSPFMAPGSVIINIASTRAFQSEPHTEAYAASKGGVVALTHALAISLGERGIRVVCLSPGWIDTSGWKKQGVPPSPPLRDIDHQQHPAGRVGKPTDIAEMCVFLVSPQAGFVSGTNIVVDGGMTKKMIYVE